MTLVWKNQYASYCANPDYETLKDGFLCVALEIVFLIAYIVFFKVKKGKPVIVLLLCAELIGTSLISFAPNKDNVTVYDAHVFGSGEFFVKQS